MKKRAMWTAALALLVIAYPLSLGPIMRYKASRGLHRFSDWPSAPMVYQPLLGMTEPVPVLRDALEAYQWLWMRDVYSIFGRPQIGAAGQE